MKTTLSPSTTLDPMESATRRDVGRGILGAGWLVLASNRNARAATPEVAPAGTRPFVDGTGREVEVPARPQRIMAIHANQTGVPLVSIGAPVIATTLMPLGFLDDYDTEGIADVGPTGEIDLEALIGLEPDLNVGFVEGGTVYLDPGVMDALYGIAPTVWMDTGGPLDDVMTAFGELTGRHEEVARQRGEWEALAGSIARSVPESLSAVFVGYYDAEGTLSLRGPNNAVAISRVLDLIGVRFPPLVAEATRDGEWGVNLSPERLNEVSADIVIWDPVVADPAALPLWEVLPAVSAEQVYSMKAGNICYDSFIRTAEQLAPIVETANPDVVDESGWGD